VPRYRFQWTNLDGNVLRGLCRDLDLEAGEPAESLRSCYGIRPTDGFVRDAWPALRDRWLAKDPLSRSEVVDALWSLGLGEGEPPAHKAEQMSFLRGRNNARRLREVVLDVFIALGETTAVAENPPDAPPVSAGAGAPARKRPEAKESRTKVRQPDGQGPTVIVDDVVRDIDSIVKQSRYTGWNETQEGDRTVRRELRMVLKRYVLPLTGPLFDNAYAYIRENY
jgi:hypothetical protein